MPPPTCTAAAATAATAATTAKTATTTSGNTTSSRSNNTFSIFSGPILFFLALIALLGALAGFEMQQDPNSSRRSSLFFRRTVALSVVYFVSGAVLSVFAGRVVGHLYEEYKNVYRPLKKSNTRYFFLHPLFLATAMSAATELILVGSNTKFAFVIAVAGATPIYALGHASILQPAPIPISWMCHTITQLLLGGFLLDALAM